MLKIRKVFWIFQIVSYRGGTERAKYILHARLGEHVGYEMVNNQQGAKCQVDNKSSHIRQA